jgi:hypothetical protein
MFLTVNNDKIIKEAASGGYATTSGIFNITMKGAEVAPTSGGATQINYITDKFISYNNIVISKNNEPTFGHTILSELAVILGEEGLSDPEETTIQFKNSSKALMCLPETVGVEVTAWIQFKYRMWNNEIQESIAVKRFFRTSDGASASEIISGEGIGETLETAKKYATNVKYEDNITAEQVAAWKASQSNDTASAPKTEAAPKATVFPTA